MRKTCYCSAVWVVCSLWCNGWSLPLPGWNGRHVLTLWRWQSISETLTQVHHRAWRDSHPLSSHPAGWCWNCDSMASLWFDDLYPAVVSAAAAALAQNRGALSNLAQCHNSAVACWWSISIQLFGSSFSIFLSCLALCCHFSNTVNSHWFLNKQEHHWWIIRQWVSYRVYRKW